MTFKKLLETHFIEAHGNGASDDEIKRIINITGSLPADYEQYLRQCGWLCFGSVELIGSGLGVPPHLELIAVACDKWMAGLSRNYIPVYIPATDWYYCIDSTTGMIYRISLDVDEEPSLECTGKNWLQWLDEELSECQRDH